MSCDVGKATEGLELCSFSKLYVASPTLQLILQPFCRLTYITAHFPTLPLLHLRHSSFSNPCFASPASQALLLRHRLFTYVTWRAAHDIVLFFSQELQYTAGIKCNTLKVCVRSYQSIICAYWGVIVLRLVHNNPGTVTRTETGTWRQNFHSQ